MGYCKDGVASVSFTDKKDQARFDEILKWVKGNISAALELFNREKLGEVISPDSSLLPHDPQLIETTLESFELKSDKDIDRLSDLVESQISSLNKRIGDLKKSMNSLKGADKTDRKATIDKLEDLLEELETLETKEKFIAIVDYTRQEMERIESWLEGGEKGFNPEKEIHRDTLLAINRQLSTYEGLHVPQFANSHSDLRKHIDEINLRYKRINESMKERMLDVVVKMHQQYSSNKNLQDIEALKAYLRESKDIDGLQSLFIDIDSSSSTTLGVIGKLYAEKRQEVADMVKSFTTDVKAAGKKLLDAGYDNQDFMVDKTTGNIITRLSSGWKTALAEKLSLTDSLEVGDDGKKIRREYITKDLEDMTAAEIQHNLDLNADKKKIGLFLRAEYWDKKAGELVDGENKKYTNEFKEAREGHEVWEDGAWVQRADVSDEAFRKYQRKYYGPIVTTWRLVKDESNEPTGEVEQFDTRFVKEEYVEVQDKWNSPEYMQIQANSAQKEFYDFYVKSYQELLDKLPADVAKRMDGRVLRIRDEFVKELTSKKTPIIKTILKYIKNLVLPDIITNGRQLDEQGFPVNDIGIFYVGDLKSQKRILQLKQEIAALRNSTDLDSRKKMAKLKNSLLIENQKLEPQELKYDLVESLTQGMAMADNYDIMKSVESTFLIVQEHLHEKKFFAGVDKFGEPIKNSKGDSIEYKKEGTSKTEQRLATWMRMIFYNNSDANNTQVGKLAMLFKRGTSITLQGFNVFSGLNNIVTAEINQIIEGVGNRFYGTGEYKRATGEMTKHLANGKWMTNMFKQPDKYTEEKPYDKLSAMVDHFNFLEEHSDRGGGIKQKQTIGQYAKSFNWMYALIEGGEYQAQVRSAIAKMMATEIVLEDGTKTNVWDVHEFDEATKELRLKEGVKFSAKDRYKVTGEIKNMAKAIHGNYSSADKVAMQETWYGELAYQFKKWMPNAIRSRFANTYYDEALGIDQQGRYRAVTALIRNISDLSLAGVKAGWENLSDLEQANMRKNAAEVSMYAIAVALYIIFDAIREGLPPEDEKTRRALNFLKKQAERSRGEMDFFVNPLQWYSQVKNPVAALSIFKESGEFLGALAGVPFHALQGKNEKNRYEKGVNKGELKVWKEFRDLVPGLRTISQWDQLDITGNFFIK